MKETVIVIILTSVLTFLGCSSQPLRQDIKYAYLYDIRSTPAGADIYFQDRLVGKAPLSYQLQHDSTTPIKIEAKLEGYQVGTATIINHARLVDGFNVYFNWDQAGHYPMIEFNLPSVSPSTAPEPKKTAFKRAIDTANPMPKLNSRQDLEQETKTKTDVNSKRKAEEEARRRALD